MSYEVLAGEDRAYCLGDDVKPDQHAEKLNAEIVEFKLHPEKCNGNKVTHYNIDLQIILRCFETGENDTLEPTAEWSRIQQALKELERVKAERDALKADSFTDTLKTMSILAETDQHMKDCKTFLEEFKKLSSLKSRLPVNRDGDVPDIGDEQWVWCGGHHNAPSPTEIHGIRDDGDGWYYIGPDDCGISPLTCHSSAESCRAAHEGKCE